MNGLSISSASQIRNYPRLFSCGNHYLIEAFEWILNFDHRTETSKNKGRINYQRHKSSYLEPSFNHIYCNFLERNLHIGDKFRQS